MKEVSFSINKKAAMVIGAFVLLAAGFILWNWLKPTPPPKKMVFKFLQSRSGRAEWKVEEARQAKEPWVELTTQLQAAAEYRAMYRSLGAFLSVADELLSRKATDQQVLGLRIALAAAHGAGSYTEDSWLMARIYEGFIMPHLSLADGQFPGIPPRDQLVALTVNSFNQSEDTDGLIYQYRRVIRRETAAHQADWARVQLAAIHKRLGEDEEAATLLQEVKDPNRKAPKVSKKAPAGK